jgi:hypothetical protein
MLARLWDSTGRFQDEWVEVALGAQLKHQTHLEVEGLLSRERFREQIFDGIRRLTFDASTRPSERIGLAGEFEFGRVIYRTFDPDVEPFLGRMIEASLEANLKLLTRLALVTTLAYERMKEPEGDALVYDGWILRSRLDLQVTREVSMRVVAEYDSFDESLAFEPLLTCRLNAFSVLYLGMSDEYLYFPETPGAEPDGARCWDLGGRQIFGKIQYLLRI